MMTSKRLDIVVFGASGYTGMHVVKELVRIDNDYPELKWAVAGRDRRKLEELLANVSKRTGEDLSSIKVIIADVKNKESLRSMCEQTKVIINCSGPFMKLGEPVVAMAIDCKTNYVDVSGEERFVELVDEKFSQAARDAEVYVVTTCGLSCVPADLGVTYLQENFGGTVNSVESYLMISYSIQNWSRIRNSIPYSTWESMINSMSSMSLKSSEKFSLPIKLKPKLESRFVLHKNFNRWCLPFPGTDTEVVRKTQSQLSMNQERPAQFNLYISFSSFFVTILAVIGAALLVSLSKITSTRKLLLKHSRLCTFGIITHGSIEDGKKDDMCLQYEMIGKGWETGQDIENTPPKKKVVGRVKVFGENAPYTGTAVVVIFCALAILKESDKMPNTRGVLTPGIAFRKTSLIKNLHRNNVTFDIIEKKYM